MTTGSTSKIIIALAGPISLAVGWIFKEAYGSWKNRIRMRVHKLHCSWDARPQKCFFNFEMENIGLSPTSLAPSIDLTGYSLQRKKWRSHFTITSADRSLPPHGPKEFLAEADNDYSASPGHWFLTYTFIPTRGRKIRVRYRLVGDEDAISKSRFFWGLFKFMVWPPSRTEGVSPDSGGLFSQEVVPKAQKFGLYFEGPWESQAAFKIDFSINRPEGETVICPGPKCGAAIFCNLWQGHGKGPTGWCSNCNKAVIAAEDNPLLKSDAE